MAEAGRLGDVERWMFDLVTHPAGLEAAAAGPGREPIDRVILPSKALTAAERLEVYASAYFSRLFDVLAEEFPAVRFLLGPSRFLEVAREFLARHPSGHYSLQFLGERFPAFLAEEAIDLERCALAAGLARLERTIEEAFHVESADPLSTDDLLAIRPEDWPAARLVPAPGLTLLAFDHPVNAFYQAFRDERQMDVPPPSPSWVVVYRKGYQVWRMPLDREGHAILAALARGRTLAEALEAAAGLPGVDFEALLGRVRALFQEWAGEGLFVEVRVGGDGA